MTNHYDVIVLGLGAMGSAAAYQLARKGKKVLGLDQYAPPHTLGSTHGDTRITRQAIGEGEEYVPLVLRSYELFREVELETGQDVLTVTGGLIMASQSSQASMHGNANFLQTTIACAEKYGITHTVLGTQAIRQRFPQFQLVGDELGYYEENAGFLRPERCIAAQLTLARRYGATIQTNERVLGFEPDSPKDGVTVTTGQGRYTADKLVVSAGPWITQLLEPEYARHFSIHRQVLYWFAFQGDMAPFLPGRFPIFIWQRQDIGIYGFPAIDGPAGGMKVATEEYQAATTPETVARAVSREEIGHMYTQHVAPCFPTLSERCVKSAVCLYTDAPDGQFVLDWHPRHPQVLIASPCSGHGFKHSAAIGEVLAELVTEGESRIDISRFAFGRFS